MVGKFLHFSGWLSGLFYSWWVTAVTFHGSSEIHVPPFLSAYGGTGTNCSKKRQDWSTTGHITIIIIIATIPSPSYWSTRHMLHITHYSTISHVPGSAALLLVTEIRTLYLTTCMFSWQACRLPIGAGGANDASGGWVPWWTLDRQNKMRNKRQTQKWKFVVLDERHFRKEGYNNTYGTMSLLLIDHFPIYRRSFIMLKRVLASLFASEMATHFLTFERSLTTTSKKQNAPHLQTPSICITKKEYFF